MSTQKNDRIEIDIHETKVKFFEAPDFDELENLVNQSIHSNALSVRDVKYHHNTFETPAGVVAHNCSAMIIYGFIDG